MPWKVYELNTTDKELIVSGFGCSLAITKLKRSTIDNQIKNLIQYESRFDDLFDLSLLNNWNMFHGTSQHTMRKYQDYIDWEFDLMRALRKNGLEKFFLNERQEPSHHELSEQLQKKFSTKFYGVLL